MNNDTPSPPDPLACPRRWPEGALVYHMYPRSFQDANGDGIGDLQGIIQRFDYLQELNVTAIWLSPFYRSPMADFGYDIADYQDVDPIFGTLDDFKQLLAVAHERNIKVMVDMVPNHTSDKHPWFVQARSSRDNPYANWYIWRDAKPSSDTTPQPPNNWQDVLTGGSAWEWDETRQQFYLHSFEKGQPDLNWTNPDVRHAIKEVMRFWLDLGVDGFRVDAVYWMGKDPLFRDDPVNPGYRPGEESLYNAHLHVNSQGWPTLYSYLTEMASLLEEPQYAERQPFMVTEAYPQRHNPIASYMAFYESMDPMVAAPFNFEGLELPWRAGDWRHFLRPFHYALSEHHPCCVASYAFGNHDKSRLATRIGEEAARSAAVMQLTLPGMIFVYYGEELGMRDVILDPEQVQDPAAKGDPMAPGGRDPARTPMQWSADKNAGFSTADHTWLPVASDYQTRNVGTQAADPHSFLSLYRRLAALRAKSPALRYGSFAILDTGQPEVVAYVREFKDEHFVVLINFSDQPVTFTLRQPLYELLVSSHPQSKLANALDGEIELLAHEGALFR